RRARVRNAGTLGPPGCAPGIGADEGDDVETGVAQRGHVDPAPEPRADHDRARGWGQYPSSASTTCSNGSSFPKRLRLWTKISTAACCISGVYHEMCAPTRTCGCV